MLSKQGNRKQLTPQQRFERNAKLAKYLPFIYCCNEGGLKIAWGQVVQVTIGTLVAVVISTLIATRLAMQDIRSDVNVIKVQVMEMKECIKETSDRSIDNSKDIGKLEERIESNKKEMDHYLNKYGK